MSSESIERLVVFGAGPQAWRHVDAMCAIRAVNSVRIVGTGLARVENLVRYCRDVHGLDAASAAPRAAADADLVVCCTSSQQPLFDGAILRDDAVVVAVGAHTTTARELDDTALKRSALVVVEARSAALREAGDIVLAVNTDSCDPTKLVNLAELMKLDSIPQGVRTFKSVGMGWEDLAVAAAAYERASQDRT